MSSDKTPEPGATSAPSPAPGPDSVAFAAELFPHRSLDPRAAWAVALGVSALCLVISVPFAVLGAWPVAGFLGLDALAILTAFHICQVRARERERLRLTPAELSLQHVSHRGEMRETRFNPRWVRLEKRAHPEFGIEELALVEGRRRVPVGRFLPAEEKAEVASALGEALRETRRP